MDNITDNVFKLLMREWLCLPLTEATCLQNNTIHDLYNMNGYLNLMIHGIQDIAACIKAVKCICPLYSFSSIYIRCIKWLLSSLQGWYMLLDRPTVINKGVLLTKMLKRGEFCYNQESVEWDQDTAKSIKDWLIFSSSDGYLVPDRWRGDVAEPLLKVSKLQW